MEPNWAVCDSSRTVWAASGIIYALNRVLMCMRLEWPWISGSQSGADVW